VARGEEVLARSEQLTRQRLPTSVDLISTDLLQARSAGAAIVDEAIEQNADVILMATAITVKYGKHVTGDAAGYVIKNAPCDVILIRSESDLELQEVFDR
jgi:nucleotide-binding universal stress UspA family protein